MNYPDAPNIDARMPDYTKIMRPRAQRIVQIISGLFYLWLIIEVIGSIRIFPPDFYLRIDPAIAVNASIVTRTIPRRLIAGILLLLVPLMFGRVFCGWVCPMGIAIDMVDWIAGRYRRKTNGVNPGFRDYKKWRWFKYGLLFFFVGSSLAGISTYFYASPISLLNRFFVSVIYPFILTATSVLFEIVRPLAKILGFEHLYYLTVKERVFNTNFFVFLLVGSIFSLSLLSRRFWCRYACPSGAILGLLSGRPLVRRTVSKRKCTECGACQKQCPMGAIENDPTRTRHEECLSCLKCSSICPVNAVTFSFKPSKTQIPVTVRKERRKMVLSGVGGVISAVLFYTSPSHVRNYTKKGANKDIHLIRPPGSIPETDFLRRCSRCYECIIACPTNTLQPIWLEAGLEAIWTPKVTTSFAPCDKDCALCGQVCPTGAIRPVALKDKIFCKIGTARIYKNRCLAWEYDRKCLVCDEVCPYDAVNFIAVKYRKNRVPVVDANRCSGCGYCETHCPASGKKAIIVEASGEIRIARGSYKEEAVKRNLKIRLRNMETIPDFNRRREEEKMPPGFDFSK